MTDREFNGREYLEEFEPYLEEFIDELDGMEAYIDTNVDFDAIIEQLVILQDDIRRTRKWHDAALYLSTTPFANRKNTKVNETNLKAVSKELGKIGIWVKPEELTTVLNYYNSYYKGSFNAYSQY